MKKSVIIASAALLLFAFKPVDQSTWTVDKAHSQLGFSIEHLGVSDIMGAFTAFDCTITTSKEDFSDAVIELNAESKSVNTLNEKRDEHLKSPDFFDAAKFPTITFKSKSFKKVSEGKYKVTGDFTMHGVTKVVELNASMKMGTNPMAKKAVAGFRVSGTIKRTDYGVGASMPGMLGDDVMLVADAEFMKK
jgi:polyisoprenoid-binding protein YceI